MFYKHLDHLKTFLMISGQLTVILLGTYQGLGNKKDAVMSHCLERKKVGHATWQDQS